MNALPVHPTSLDPIPTAPPAATPLPSSRAAEPRCGPLRLWWDLIAGPGPRWLRLLRWAQRNRRD